MRHQLFLSRAKRGVLQPEHDYVPLWGRNTSETGISQLGTECILTLSTLGRQYIKNNNKNVKNDLINHCLKTFFSQVCGICLLYSNYPPKGSEDILSLVGIQKCDLHV